MTTFVSNETFKAIIAVANEVPNYWYIEKEMPELGRVVVRERSSGELITPPNGMNPFELLEMIREHWLEQLHEVLPAGWTLIIRTEGYAVKNDGGVLWSQFPMAAQTLHHLLTCYNVMGGIR